MLINLCVLGNHLVFVYSKKYLTNSIELYPYHIYETNLIIHFETIKEIFRTFKN